MSQTLMKLRIAEDTSGNYQIVDQIAWNACIEWETKLMWGVYQERKYES